MSDTLRRYERELEREGRDKRAVATSLLGVDPARFLILFPVSEPEVLVLAKPYTRIWERVDGSEAWEAVRGHTVVTLQDVADYEGEFWIWDTKHERTFPRDDDDFETTRVEPGWRTPREGPRARSPSTSDPLDALPSHYSERPIPVRPFLTGVELTDAYARAGLSPPPNVRVEVGGSVTVLPPDGPVNPLVAGHDRLVRAMLRGDDRVRITPRCRAELDHKRCLLVADHDGAHENRAGPFRVPDPPPVD